VSGHLIVQHGGKLVELLVDPERAAELKLASRDWPSWDLTPRQLCDLELLLSGGFSPLRGFLARGDYEAVCAGMRLADGTIWPIPVVLDVPEPVAVTLGAGASLALRDPEGVLLAVLRVDDVWRPDRQAEALAVYGTTDREHPGVAHLLDRTHPWYAGGRVEGIQLPVHYDFRALRLTPAALRAEFSRLGWRRVVAFQTRNPLHRAHQELTLRAAREARANLLIHPVVGMTRPGNVDHYTRVRCYQAVLDRYPRHTVALALLPWPCAWPVRARPSGTRSSGRTTAAATSSSAATTPGRETTRGAARSTTPTPRRIDCASTKRSWASRWCRSG
jgi:sulfate adenylyltransferase